MKKLFLTIVSAIFMFSFVEGQTYEQPVLISSAGQSADVKLVNLLAKRNKLNVNTKIQATADDLSGAKTLIIVPGFSSKGLGAAGISQKDEMARVEKLIKAANSKNIPIILVHIGGNARRKGQSDAFNKVVADNAKQMLVVAQGDQDGFFTDLSKTNNIPLEVVPKTSAATGPLGKLFK